MAESIEDRLRSHAKAFDGLLQIIPAKYYYGEDTSEQWKRKKQTKEEARAAKLAKLDPDNAKSAKDVMVENAKKRKREEEVGLSDTEGVELERPKEGLKDAKKSSKKQKKEEKPHREKTATADVQAKSEELDTEALKTAKAAKRREKRQQRKAREDARTAKAQVKKARKFQEIALVEDEKATLPPADESDEEIGDGTADVEIDPIDVTGLINPINQDSHVQSTATPSPTPQSPIFEFAPVQSGTSSISSVALTTTSPSHSQSQSKLKESLELKPNAEELKIRLQQKIEALRAARNARVEGEPARNRQELMESRRKKEEQRKAHKKELRAKAREEERQQRELALSRASPLFSPAVMSPASGSNAFPQSNNFAFGRIAFENGQAMTANLSAVLEPHKTKGPQDPHTALLAASKRADRLAALDSAKRADIEDKDVWLNARKRAHGEKIRDDSSLLKKTLKRKEKAKKKSEKEWGERIEGVRKGQAMKQRKREENIQKRKDEKGNKGKKVKAKPKTKSRPGFEGSFRAKAGKKS